ncbi:hypothetical protein ABZU94_08465 [Streptomyces mirabilis]|uniref:hypothetical protein n=1 Tax=Streptomyces sp. NPDC005388 TaxID=3156717 RepID=UPI0033A5A008
MRVRDVAARLPFISEQLVGKRLAQMHADGLVTRAVIATAPRTSSAGSATHCPRCTGHCPTGPRRTCRSARWPVPSASRTPCADCTFATRPP